MINFVCLTGRITKDPELVLVNGNIPLVNFTLAVNRNFKNSSGIYETDFIRCVAWRQQAETLCKYITKGSLIGIEGNIRVSNYDNIENNQKQFVTKINCNSIHFLEFKKDNFKMNGKNEDHLMKHNLNNDELEINEKEKDQNYEEIKIEEDDGLAF
ncbi:single-stranded DNA-binding protein [Texas Phoenix palm phytoplasma]|uniref:Single-stranded DNA-binding protein n=1 Tax=Texas Phoenix palm phytoplasma TaxID=176709 RepID=A0ABS5BI24_9MOLU|nr:single-stranded DNA-binding protein [Texas Phoenix palm phytoplasma]MBP3059233.1 single-stranded DNA-binding protein [Texas Phoenix palm phytoplasma]